MPSFFGRLNYFEKWFFLGVIAGVIAGLAAVVFYNLMHFFEELFIRDLVGMTNPKPLGEGGDLSFQFNPGNYFLIPLSVAIGGLLSGLLVYTFAPEAEGHGTDAAIRAYHFHQGKIRWVIVPVKVLTSAITIGSGGSAGREGPTAQFSAGIGSLLAGLFKLSPEDRRIMVAVGLGAGVGAIFKAPFGGALLAAEVLYRRDIEVEVLYPAFIASAVGYVVFGVFFGYAPVFGTYAGNFLPESLPLFAVLGVVNGIIAILYVKTFYSVHNYFKRIRVNRYFKPVIGGLATGLLGLIAPEILGAGYGWINLVIYEKFDAFYSPVLPPLLLLALLPFLKILATSFSIGSGGSGGVFAPGLFIGAFVGANLGLLFRFFYPDLVPSLAPFVIVGMASFFAAAGKVPLSVMVMVTEMTGTLELLPATMIATALSYLSSWGYSIYQSQVETRRDSPAHRLEYEIPTLRVLKVKDAELADIKVFINEKVGEAVYKMLSNDIMSLPVVDGYNKFIGVVNLRDLEKADLNDVVEKYVVKGTPYVTPDSALEEALELMARLKTRWVCVVKDGKYIGILTIDNIIKTYKQHIQQVL